MKKYFMIFAMAQMVLWSCAKPEIETPATGSLNSGKVLFSATAETLTKTAPAAGGVVTWTMEDEIGVYDGTNYVKATVESVDGKNITFSATVDKEAANYIAVSPYEAALTDAGAFTLDGGNVKISTAAAQNSGKQVVSIATITSADEPFVFKNVGNLLRFKVNKAAVKMAKITGATGEELLAGVVSVDPETAASTGTLTEKAITVDITPGQDNFIALAPGTSLPGGFVITLYGDEDCTDYQGEVASVAPIDFTGENARNNMTNLSTIDGWIDNYKLWQAGKPITIAGVEYSKESNDNATLLSADSVGDLKTILHDKTTDIVLFFNPGEYSLATTPNIGKSSAECNVLMIGRYDNAKAKIIAANGITNSWFSILGGYMACKNIHFDMTVAPKGVFRTYTYRKLSKVHVENCRFEGLNYTTKPLIAFDNKEIHGISSIRFVNCDMSSTYAGLCVLINCHGEWAFLDEVDEVIFDNNIVYNTSASGFLRIFHAGGPIVPSSGQTQDTQFRVRNNTFYNFPPGIGNSSWATYITSYSLSSLTITDNIFWTKGTPTVTNILVYSKDETTQYPFNIDRNVSNVPTLYYFNPNQGVYHTSSKTLPPTSTNIFSVENTTTGVFTPVSAYAAYGAKR